jgi:hypothetical protein
VIVGTLATFPPRRDALIETVTMLATQLDRLHVVLNEYDGPLPELEQYTNVLQIVLPEDLKDTGKFYPDVSDATWVFLLDDDIIYPTDYVSATLKRMTALGPGRWLGGYHGSLYRARKFSLNWCGFKAWARSLRHGTRDRKVFAFQKGLDQAVVVDQLGSGVAVLAAADMPPFDYMRSAQKFVDVRMARWAFEQKMTNVCLPREKRWLDERYYEETIFEGFTQTYPSHVTAEIVRYAFKSPRLGETVPGPAV